MKCCHACWNIQDEIVVDVVQMKALEQYTLIAQTRISFAAYTLFVDRYLYIETNPAVCWTRKLFSDIMAEIRDDGWFAICVTDEVIKMRTE